MLDKKLQWTIQDYTCAFNAISCSMFIIDHQLHVIYQNTSAEQMIKEMHMSYEDVVEKLAKQIDIVEGQGRFAIKNGDLWLICNIYPWIREGVRNGSVLVLHESGKQACTMQELNVINNTLREIDAIVESAADGIIVADKNGVIIRVNAAVEHTFGVERKSLLGRKANNIVQAGIFKEGIVQKVIDTEKKVTIASDYEMKKLVYTGIPIFDDRGTLTSIVVNIQDASALNELQQELEYQRMMMDGYVREMANLTNKMGTGSNMVACSRKMMKIVDVINVVSEVDSVVLITGESGTGKEVVVDEIYRRSRRKDKPFIKINCGAIPDTLFESELFGYESGAFTGARRQGKIGFFELADTGTLFLDEVGELSMASQVKLLRVIQEREVLRIGGSKPSPIDVRLIAATNRDLWQMVEEGKFRQDLYYRLNVINIDIPPLRDRRDDIIPLARHFLDTYNMKYGKKKKLSIELGHILSNLDWPGNIRELENVVETMVVLAPGNLLLPEHLPEKYDEEKADSAITIHGIIPLKDAVREVERQLFQRAKDKYRTTREIARALGIDQSTVSRKMKNVELS